MYVYVSDVCMYQCMEVSMYYIINFWHSCSTTIPCMSFMPCMLSRHCIAGRSGRSAFDHHKACSSLQRAAFAFSLHAMFFPCQHLGTTKATYKPTVPPILFIIGAMAYPCTFAVLLFYSILEGVNCLFALVAGRLNELVALFCSGIQYRQFQRNFLLPHLWEPLFYQPSTVLYYSAGEHLQYL